MSHQDGNIWKKNNAWYGRWWQDELKGGQIVRRRRARKLADHCDRYRSEKDVRPLLAEILQPLNNGKPSPQSTRTVAAYFDGFFLPYIKAELKPSTVNGYKQLWRMYLAPRLQKAVLRDFRCVDATNLLADIHREHGIGRKTLRHCKALLSSIFTFAKRQGALDGLNPVSDAGIPNKAAKSNDTHAATVEEVMAMLAVLTGQAKVAVALMYFAGLRPGEACGARWSDYAGETLAVRRSVWKRFVTDPKTESSVAEVPIPEILQGILEEHRLVSVGQYILSGEKLGRPLDLHNLANRVVIPTLRKAGIPWHGWYSLRRGLPTFAKQQVGDQAAMGALRHKNIATTQQHYIKQIPAETLKVPKRLDEAFRPSGMVQ